MKNFIIIAGNSDTFKEMNDRIQLNYSEHSFELREGIWAIAVPPEITASDICDVVGIGEVGAGVTIEISGSYYGYFNGAFWDKLSNWAAL